MLKRALLRKQIAEAWIKAIDGNYNQRLINSERGLQIYFCHELMECFREDKKKRKIFVEPCVKSGDERRYPDLLICNSNHIIGVIEIKYLPRGRPKCEKDIGTLNFFATHRDGLEIANDRYQGPFKQETFQLATDTVLCWAGVYTGTEPLELRGEVEESHRDRFLQLDALTNKSEPPKKFVDGKMVQSRKDHHGKD